MNQVKTQEVTPSKGTLISVIGNWKNLYRALILFCGFMIIIVASIMTIYHFITSQPGIKLEITDKGGIVLHTRNKDKLGKFLLPASAGWTNTGFILKPGQTVDIQSFGKIHLGFHRLVEAAINDSKPAFPWINPAGSRFKAENKQDKHRKDLLVDPSANIGMLLGHLAEVKLPNGGLQPGKYNPKPGRIYQLGSTRGITNQSRENRELWLTVNDMYLHKKAKKAYMGQTTTEEEKESSSNRWDKIKKDEYWELWFDDNIGQYFVTVTYIN